MKIKSEWVIGVFCIALVTVMVVKDVRIWGFQFIAYYFLFYSLGYYLHKYQRFITRKNYIYILLSTLWFAMAWFWNMHKLPVFLSSTPLPQSIMQYLYRFLTAVVAIYVLLGVSPKLLDNGNKWNQPLLNAGKISLGIYTTHILIMPFIVKALFGIMNNRTVVIIIAFVLALMLSWIVVLLLGKWKVTARLLLGKL